MTICRISSLRIGNEDNIAVGRFCLALGRAANKALEKICKVKNDLMECNQTINMHYKHWLFQLSIIF